MINIGVIGCGHWGRNLIRVLDDLEALTAVCDTNEDNLLSIRSDSVNLDYLTNYKDLLDDIEIDGIVVATPAETHYEIVRDAILAGKDVFVEKPMTLDSRQAEELVAMAQGSILMVGHVLLYHPTIQKIKENIGDLGKISQIVSTRLNWGTFRDHENCWWSFAPHDISVIVYMLDKLPIGGTVHGDRNCTQTLLEFDKGEKAYIQVSWLYPTKMHRLALVGDKGKVEFDGLQPTVPEPLKEEMRHFIHCVETREKPLTHGKHGLDVVRILERCNKLLERQIRE